MCFSPAVCLPHCAKEPARRGPALGWGSSPTSGSPSREGVICVWEPPIFVNTPPSLYPNAFPLEPALTSL